MTTGVNIGGGPTAPAPLRAFAPDGRPDPKPAVAEEDRWIGSKAAIYAGVATGITQNTLDAVRLTRKYPEAVRAARYDPTLSRLGRLPTAVGLTLPPRPDNRILDPRAPLKATAESAGRSFTRWDARLMRTSVLLGASMAGMQLATAIPNLAEAALEEGPWQEDLLGTTSGRAGVLQLGGGALGTWLFRTALRQTRGDAAPGMVNRLVAAGNAPIMAWPLWGRIALGTSALVLANESGYFDFLNPGDARPAAEVLRTEARATPVLNDPLLRTGAILGLGGMVAYKARPTMRAASLAGRAAITGLKPLHAASGAVVAGFLGAQLLGGLRSIDRSTGT